jgi:TonB family protein
MRVEFLPSIDFNQMLVYSAFVHLLFFTWIMFFPNSKTQERIVVPTFRLDLIDLSSKAKSAESSKAKPSLLLKKTVAPKTKAIVEKLKRSKLKPKPKQSLSPKPIIKKSKARQKILEDLKSLESKQSLKSPLQQLDLLAGLNPKTQEEKIILKTRQEETFRDLDAKKVDKLFTSIKPKDKPTFKTTSELIDDVEITAKERELMALSEQLVKLDLNKKDQTTATLMEELEALEKKKTHSTDILLEGEALSNSNTLSSFKSIKGESLTSVVKKFQELEAPSEEIEIDISKEGVVLKEFKTSIQRNEVLVADAKSESEVSNTLSLYIGQVYKRIYSKWKTPLGSKFEDVVVSFTIFSKGNIDSPIISKGTGDKNLDSIAVRAIIDSVPFPELPKELNRSNLKINIIFKYVSEKN